MCLKKSGRRSPIDNETLWHRRDQILACLIENWLELVPSLRCARTPAHVTKVFAAAKHTFSNEVFRNFRVRSSAGFERLFRHRKAREELSRKLRDSNKTASELGEFRADIANALRQATGDGREQFESMNQSLTRDWQAFNDKCMRLSAEIADLTAQIEFEEAAFAQAELLRFIQERRYAWNPENLANAMAGLGYMTYRRSVRRCTARRSMVAKSLRWEVLRAITFLCENTRPRQLLSELVENVLRLPPRYASAQHELTEKFYFLRIAVEESIRDCYRGEAFTFAVMQKYSRQLRSISPLDVLCAEDHRLR